MSVEQEKRTGVDERMVVVAGLLGYCALAAMTRLCKDGDQALTMVDAVEHAYMADRAFHGFAALEQFAGENGFDLTAATSRFSGLFDEMEARTRPSTWWERSLKTYIAFSVMGDLLLGISRGLPIDCSWVELDFGQRQWEEERLRSEIMADEQLAARLSLWGRRVVGDMLSLGRATLFTYPELGVSPQEADTLVRRAEENYAQRMKDLGLQP